MTWQDLYTNTYITQFRKQMLQSKWDLNSSSNIPELEGNLRTYASSPPPTTTEDFPTHAISTSLLRGTLSSSEPPESKNVGNLVGSQIRLSCRKREHSTCGLSFFFTGEKISVSKLKSSNNSTTGHLWVIEGHCHL